jgi:Dienelactone hydrolase family/Universal stress protein family
VLGIRAGAVHITVDHLLKLRRSLGLSDRAERQLPSGVLGLARCRPLVGNGDQHPALAVVTGMLWVAAMPPVCCAGSDRDADIRAMKTESNTTSYLALPDGTGPHPGVVVIHEASGLNDNIRDICRRFAGQGYAAQAVDLFAGRNRGICMARMFIGGMAGNLDYYGVPALKAAVGHLADRTEVDANRIGAIGFCLGGSVVLTYRRPHARRGGGDYRPERRAGRGWRRRIGGLRNGGSLRIRRGIPARLWTDCRPRLRPAARGMDDRRRGPAKFDRAAACVQAETLAGWTEKYPDVDVVSRLVPRRPVLALVGESAGATLLVVGSYGHGWFAGMLLGSVSQAVLRHASVSVAVARPVPSARR